MVLRQHVHSNVGGRNFHTVGLVVARAPTTFRNSCRMNIIAYAVKQRKNRSAQITAHYIQPDRSGQVDMSADRMGDAQAVRQSCGLDVAKPDARWRGHRPCSGIGRPARNHYSAGANLATWRPEVARKPASLTYPSGSVGKFQVTHRKAPELPPLAVKRASPEPSKQLPTPPSRIQAILPTESPRSRNLKIGDRAGGTGMDIAEL